MQRLFFPSSGRQGECVCENGEVAPPSFLFRRPLPLQICTSDHELPVDFLSPGKQSKLELNCSERSPCSPGRVCDGSGGCWPRVEKSVCVLRRQAEIRRYVSPLPNRLRPQTPIRLCGFLDFEGGAPFPRKSGRSLGEGGNYKSGH